MSTAIGIYCYCHVLCVPISVYMWALLAQQCLTECVLTLRSCIEDESLRRWGEIRQAPKIRFETVNFPSETQHLRYSDRIPGDIHALCILLQFRRLYALFSCTEYWKTTTRYKWDLPWKTLLPLTPLSVGIVHNYVQTSVEMINLNLSIAFMFSTLRAFGSKSAPEQVTIGLCRVWKQLQACYVL